MLANLHIKNMVLIPELDMDFRDGLNILTGETGAGKSIIIGALGICLGGRFDAKLLRDENEEGVCELTFFVREERVKKGLAELGIETGEEDELVISRILPANGRCKNRINGITVPLNVLKEAAALLIDLHAQHEQQTLLKPHRHLEIVDEFGGDEIAKKKQAVAEAYAVYSALLDEKKQAVTDASEREKRMDYLEYQIAEIEAAKLAEGEDEELEAFYKKAEHARDIMENANKIYLLTGDGNGNACGAQLSRALPLLKTIAELDPQASDLAQMLEQADALLGDFNRALSDYMGDLEFDESELMNAERRLDTINGLKMKYGQSIALINEALSSFRKEHEKLTDYEAYLASLDKKVADAETKLEKACADLHKARVSASERLTKTIREALLELNFLQVEFDMSFEKTEAYTAEGYDRAVFMISTNVGEPMRPLHEIASGGELSRVMLAIKSSMASKDDTPTLVFDEIDVGISGKTAQAVSKRLAVLAKEHQVLCITHLPQIAAMADHHYVIEKRVTGEKTVTGIRHLSKEDSVKELARLLTGEELTEAALENARILIEEAKK